MKAKKKWTISMMALGLSIITCMGIGGSTIFGAAGQESAKMAKEAQTALAADEESVAWDTENAISIELKGDTVLLANGTAVTDKEIYSISFDGTTLSIGKAGTYVLSGELNGNIVISSSKKDEVVLVLNGVTVECAEDEALLVKKTGQLTLILADGTENVLTSGSETQITDTSADDAADVAARTYYGCEIHAAVEHENVFAAQFHPEKSSAVGMKILENFCRLD